MEHRRIMWTADEGKRSVLRGCGRDGARAGTFDRKDGYAVKMHRSVCTDSEGLSGTACGCAGRLMQEIADFSLLYSQLLLLYYRFTGEKETVDRYYGIADGILKHFSQYAREDGLLEQVADKWNLVDWPENLRDGYDFPLTRPVVALGCHNVINALYIGAMETQNTLAEICGREMPYQTKEIKKAYRNAFTGKRQDF